ARGRSDGGRADARAVEPRRRLRQAEGGGDRGRRDGGPRDAAARAAGPAAPPADHRSARVDARGRAGGRRPRARTRRPEVRLAGPGRRAGRQTVLLHRAGGRQLPRARGGVEAGIDHLPGRHGDDRDGVVRFGTARPGQRAGAALRAPPVRRAWRRLRGGGRARSVPGRAAERRGDRVAQGEGREDRAQPAPLSRRQRETRGRDGGPALRTHRAHLARCAPRRTGRALPGDRARSVPAAAVRALPARRRPHRHDDGGLPHGGRGLVEPRSVRGDGVLRGKQDLPGPAQLRAGVPPGEAAETMSASGPPGFGAPGAINPYSPPAASIEASSPAAASGYRSALPLAQAMVVILGMEVVLELISDLNAFLTIGVMQRVMAGQQVAETQLSAIDTRTSAVAVLGMVLTVIVIVQFCLFMPRANRNARSFGSQLRITPRWAAGFLFVPTATLGKPYQAMKEIWQGSDPDPNVHAWSVEAPALMKWWWGAYLLSNIGTYLTVRTAKISPSAEE